MTASDQRSLAWRLLAATVIGIVTGLVVLLLEHTVDDVIHELFEAPVWVPAAALLAGAIATAVIIRYFGGRSSATTEVYVEEFHRTEPEVEPKHAPARLLAAFTTLGSGAPLGMEGPAVYTGTVAATVLHRRRPTIAPATYHALLVAGAAAGIAAVFKAPAAGAIFAMEVPFRGRLAGERVLPAIFGSAAGYLTMASVDGVKPEIEVPLIELTYGRVLLSAVLGLVVGVAAIGVIKLVNLAEESHHRWSPGLRAVLAGVALAGIYALGRGLTGTPIAIASGTAVIVPGLVAMAVTRLIVGARSVSPAQVT
jgi:CIC family chloride channel protein